MLIRGIFLSMPPSDKKPISKKTESITVGEFFEWHGKELELSLIHI